MNYIYYQDLSDKEKEQATQTYISIRAEEEQKQESQVNSQGVESCKFIREDDGYISVII